MNLWSKARIYSINIQNKLKHANLISFQHLTQWNRVTQKIGRKVPISVVWLFFALIGIGLFGSWTWSDAIFTGSRYGNDVRFACGRNLSSWGRPPNKISVFLIITNGTSLGSTKRHVRICDKGCPLRLRPSATLSSVHVHGKTSFRFRCCESSWPTEINFTELLLDFCNFPSKELLKDLIDLGK